MMRTRYGWLYLLAFAPLFLTGCNDSNDTPTPLSAVVDKTVTFHIFTENDYSDARWQNSKMQLHFDLRHVNLASQKETMLLDTTLAWMPFQQFPTQAGKMQLIRRFSDIDTTQENLVLHVSKVVSVNDYETVLDYNQPLTRTKAAETVEIKL